MTRVVGQSAANPALVRTFYDRVVAPRRERLAAVLRAGIAAASCGPTWTSTRRCRCWSPRAVRWWAARRRAAAGAGRGRSCGVGPGWPQSVVPAAVPRRRGTGRGERPARRLRVGPRRGGDGLAPSAGHGQPPVPPERPEGDLRARRVLTALVLGARRSAAAPAPPARGRNRPRPARRRSGPARRSRRGRRPAGRSPAASRCPAARAAARRSAACDAARRDRRGLAAAAGASLRHRDSRHTLVLGDVLDRREPTDRIAVDRRVADRQLALVPGGQDQVPLLVGDAISVVPRTRACRFSSASPVRCRRPWNASTIGAIGTVRKRRARCAGQVRGVVAGVLGGVRAGQRDAVDVPAPSASQAMAATRAESMPPDSPSTTERNRSCARSPAGPDQRGVDLLLVGIRAVTRRGDRRMSADPAAGRARCARPRPPRPGARRGREIEVEDEQVVGELGGAGDQRAVRRDDE